MPCVERASKSGAMSSIRALGSVFGGEEVSKLMIILSVAI
jgi:hypothetical protein